MSLLSQNGNSGTIYYTFNHLLMCCTCILIYILCIFSVFRIHQYKMILCSLIFIFSNSNHPKDSSQNLIRTSTNLIILVFKLKLGLKEETRHVQGSLYKALKNLVISRHPPVLDSHARRTGVLVWKWSL